MPPSSSATATGCCCWHRRDCIPPPCLHVSARRTGKSLFLSAGLSRELIKLRLLALALLNQRVGLLSASTALRLLLARAGSVLCT
eukprot:scaffold68327_cov32-Phaeocystis_antarctica.AAC.1